MRAHPVPPALALLGSLLLASPARADGGAYPDLSILLLPSAPGTSELSLMRPPPRYGAPWPAIIGLGVGVGAGAMWSAHVPMVAPLRDVTRAESAALFAVTGVSVLGVLTGATLPRRALSSRHVRALLVVGPGGLGLTLAVPF
jgi:hypothetical protein